MTAIGTDAAHQNTVLEAAVTHGDYLYLDLSMPNSGPQGGMNPDVGFAKGAGGAWRT